MNGKLLLAGAGAAALLAVGGCEQYDPLYKDGLWHPQHVNRADLTMMAANPADLVHGTGSRTSDGQLAAAAIQRLHDNKVKKLPDAGLSEVRLQSQGGNSE